MMYLMYLTEDEYKCIMKAAKILQDRVPTTLPPQPTSNPTDAPDFSPTIYPKASPYYFPAKDQILSSIIGINESTNQVKLICTLTDMPCKPGKSPRCVCAGEYKGVPTAVACQYMTLMS